jgi:capsular exopolysaccharide synthesis family protein
MNTNRHYLVSNLSPQSPYTEAYRIARTNLLAYPASLRTIMVTSARSGQGKSTVTTNLGIVTAQMGRRVIIVEGDMRRPVLHRFFALENEVGLSEVLQGKVTLSEALQDTKVDNLLLLGSGRPPSHPAELMGSRAMRDLLDMLRAQADIVFIDTPPVSAFSDPLILAREVDAVILAYRARQVPREVDVRARAQLEAMQANILGVVLTNVEPDVCDSYYYHYTYYEAKKRDGGQGNGSNGSHSISSAVVDAEPVMEDEETESYEAEVRNSHSPLATHSPAVSAASVETEETSAFVGEEEGILPSEADEDEPVESASDASTDIVQPLSSSRRLMLGLALVVVVALIVGMVIFLMKGG